MLILVLWPAAIAWRRYHQGLLIRHGNSHAIAHAGFIRLGCVGLVLVTTAAIGLSGVQVAGFALIGGVIIEAAIVTIAAHRCGATNNPPPLVTDNLPSTMPEVWTFYWPLANSMLVVWGGRALLVALVARSSDSLVALAAWPAAWGLTLMIANGTRMVQQVIIKNHSLAPKSLLVGFAASVGFAFMLPLAIIGSTPIGDLVVEAFIGKSTGLHASVRSVILICSFAPFIIALQNAMQGFLIVDRDTTSVNVATWLGTATLLTLTLLGIHNGMLGAEAAAVAMIASLIVETSLLAVRILRGKPAHALHSQTQVTSSVRSIGRKL
jgi:hypothetical protein